MKSTRQFSALKAFGRIEGFKNDLNMLGTTLGNLSFWLPAAPLKKQCDIAIKMIDDIAERLERKLVMTIVGPCGAGKSTLLNALAGVDDLSPSGHQRPTTGHVIVFSNDSHDGSQLIKSLGSDAVEVKSSAAAQLLEHVSIIDTPDTDSTAYEKHNPLVREAIARSDMLICVFDSENPKRKDHVDFMAPFIRQFNGASLVCVINKCDRQDELELKNRILPDFSTYIQNGWQTTVDRLLCISARSHLQNPQWDPKAAPKHDFDQFEELQQLIFDNINQAGYVVDRRLENVRSLRDFVFDEVGREIAGHREPLTGAAEQFREAEKKSYMDAIAAMKKDDSRQILGVSLMVYQKLAQRWFGPIGWMIAIWARLLLFGAGFAALFRFGRPVSQMIGLISAWRHYKDSQSAITDTTNDERLATGWRTYRLTALSNWPDIAETLIAGGFDSSVRRGDETLSAVNSFSEKFAEIWAGSLESEMERSTQMLSGTSLQLFFNLPALAVLAYTGWITVERFLTASYLAIDFFVHALWTIGIILLMSFFLFQICVRMTASPERLTARAFEKMRHQADQFDETEANPVLQQLNTILSLDAMLAGRQK
jgi:GTPase SAR1 family protein